MRSVQCFVFLVTVGNILCQLFTEEKQSTACGPSDGLHVSLNCSPSQWIHVVSEQYSATPPDGAPCKVSMTCRRSQSSHDTGLEVNCNGEVREGGGCEEATAAQKLMADCVQASDRAAVEVLYECVAGNDVMDMCSNEIRTWSFPFPDDKEVTLSAYLATPAFPHTPATSQQCTCNVTGEGLSMMGLEIGADVGESASMLDVLTVEANGTTQWSMAHSGKGGRVQYLQEVLLLPVGEGQFKEATVVYRDFNLPGQIAWIRVYAATHGKGDNLTISCQSILLPPRTTTTTTTTTTTPTPSTTIIPSTTADPITSPPTSTTIATTTITTTGSRHFTPDRVSGGGDGGGMTLATPSSGETYTASDRPWDAPTTTPACQTLCPEQSKENGEDAGVITGLVILVIVLIAMAAILGCVIWRRYQRAKKSGQLEEGGGGCGAFLGLQYWCSHKGHHRHHHYHYGNEATNPVGNFHNLGFIDQSQEVEGQGQDDKDLRLPVMPLSGRGSEQGTGEDYGEDSKHDDDGSGKVHGHGGPPSLPPSGHGSELIHAQNQTQGSRSSEENQKSAAVPALSSKKEKFVAKVLDETLEDIISQRKALAGNTPSPLPPSSSHHHATTLLAPPAISTTTASPPVLPPPPQTLSKSATARSRDLECSHQRDRTDMDNKEDSLVDRPHRNTYPDGDAGSEEDAFPSWNTDMESSI